ncbi:MAG: pantoate--beta-alanine ligase [Bacteriovoracaceae bacterium]
MLEVIKTTEDLKKIRNQIQGTVGFVPTMGNLHRGHISLLERSLKEKENTFLSIFVNPMQFGPNEDFAKYPRTIAEDIKKIESKIEEFKIKNTVYLFTPASNEEIYPEGFSTVVGTGPLANILCGKIRPGHFDGVTTVMYRLLQLVKPEETFMGEKDFQQLFLIKKMVRDLELPYNITGLPIIRDTDGLALSSRNQYLTQEERTTGLILPKRLQEVARAIKENMPQAKIQSMIDQTLQDKRWDYFEVRSTKDLFLSQERKGIVILGAFRLRQTRLLDNIVIS